MNSPCVHPLGGQRLRRFALQLALVGLGGFSGCRQLLGQSTDAPMPSSLRPVTVTGRADSLHDVTSEFDLVGPAKQPEWTARRAFGETDVYVIPTGAFEFNQFYTLTHPRAGKPAHTFESEFELGIPWRTQFDVELNYNATGGRMTYDSTLIELPHALANWGVIPLNPTLDAGWRFNADKSDAYFFRLLLADDIAKTLHFGATLSFQNQVGGVHEKSYELNTALSWAVIDRRLSVGAELLVEYEAAGRRGTDDAEEMAIEVERSHTTTVMLGPTLLFRPTRNTHVGLMPRFGLTHDSPSVEALFVFGIDFEPFADHHSTFDSDRDSDRFHLFRRRR